MRPRPRRRSVRAGGIDLPMLGPGANDESASAAGPNPICQEHRTAGARATRHSRIRSSARAGVRNIRNASADLTSVYSFGLMRAFGTNDYVSGSPQRACAAGGGRWRKRSVIRRQMYAPTLNAIRSDIPVTIVPNLDHIEMTTGDLESCTTYPGRDLQGKLNRSTLWMPVVFAVSRDSKHRFSKTNQLVIRLIEGLGIEKGDAHAGTTIKTPPARRARRQHNQTRGRCISSTPSCSTSSPRRASRSAQATWARTSRPRASTSSRRHPRRTRLAIGDTADRLKSPACAIPVSR